MYHFNVSGEFIWIIHILVGLYFIYLGYKSLNKIPIGQISSIILLLLGCIMILYHAHIWYIHKNDKKHKSTLEIIHK